MTQWGVEGIFNPAKRHLDEEKRRLQSTREQVSDSSGGRRIDLESGKVVIRKPTTASDDEPDTDAPDTETPDEAQTDRAEADEEEPQEPDGDPSP